jgi:hypothetical protein
MSPTRRPKNSPASLTRNSIAPVLSASSDATSLYEIFKKYELQQEQKMKVTTDKLRDHFQANLTQAHVAIRRLLPYPASGAPDFGIVAAPDDTRLHNDLESIAESIAKVQERIALGVYEEDFAKV